MKSRFTFLLYLPVLLAFTSCGAFKATTTTTKSAQVMDIYGAGVIQKPVVADLEVKEEKVTGTATGNSANSVSDMKVEAIADAVKKANADVLIEPKFETVTSGSKTEVTVTGYPATYKNFRPITKEDAELIKEGVVKRTETYESAKATKKKGPVGAIVGITSGLVGLLIMLGLIL